MKKSPAAERTLSMFAVPEPIQAENIASEDKSARVPIEQDIDALRDTAFKYQEWSTALFNKGDSEGNEYRMSRKGDHYILQTLCRVAGALPHGYAGVMVHKRDLIAMTKVMVLAARELQTEEEKTK